MAGREQKDRAIPVRVVVTGATGLPIRNRAIAYAFDLWARWGRDERVRVEEYTACDPVLGNDSQALLVLIFAEMAARRGAGDSPDEREYAARFPQHAERILTRAGRLPPGADPTPSSSALELTPASAALGDEFEVAGVAAPAPLAFLRPPRSADECGRFAHYRVLGLLGRGGMGMVLRAEDTRLGRVVALKVMLPEVANRPKARDRFLREARSQAKLQHDNVVPIYHVGEESGVPFFEMPMLEGETLGARLKRERRLRPTAVVRVGLHAARGLAAAHKKGLVHRDVKPSNLWLEGPVGRVGSTPRRTRLLDFGLARAAEAADALTAEGMVAGTVPYMSPEQAKGDALDGRTDLFSLGVSLYQAATGRLPFRGEDPVAVLYQITHHCATPAAALVPEVPAELSALIDSLMEKSPDGRPADADQAAEEFARLAGRLPPASSPGPEAAIVSFPRDAGDPAPPAGVAGSSWPQSHDPAAEQAPPPGTRIAWQVILPAVLLLAVVGVALGGWALSGRQRQAPPSPGAAPQAPAGEPARPQPPTPPAVPGPSPDDWFKDLPPAPERFDGPHGIEFRRIDNRTGYPPGGRPPGVRAVYLATTELTQKQCRAAWPDAPTPGFSLPGKGRGDLPAGTTDTDALPMDLSFQDAEAYCRSLSRTPEALQAGRSFRVPKEAEWLTAAGAENATEENGVFAKGSEFGRLECTRPVKSQRPVNGEWYDLYGNVEEWATRGNEVVTLGGSAAEKLGKCAPRVAKPHGRADRSWYIGLRLVCDWVSPSP